MGILLLTHIVKIWDKLDPKYLDIVFLNGHQERVESEWHKGLERTYGPDVCGSSMTGPHQWSSGYMLPGNSWLRPQPKPVRTVTPGKQQAPLSPVSLPCMNQNAGHQGSINKCCFGQRVSEWKSLSRVWVFATPWTIQSVEFSRPEHWNG